MAASMDIEDTVIDDVAGLLTAAGIANHAEGARLAKATSWENGRVAIKAEVAGASLRGGQFPAGFPRVTLTLTCQSHMSKDATGATARDVAKSVREVIEVEELAANLTAQSSRATYYGFLLGPSFADNDERLHQLALTYDLILRPSTP